MPKTYLISYVVIKEIRESYEESGRKSKVQIKFGENG